MIRYVLFLVSILVSANTGAGQTPAYKPTDVFLINCGASSNASDNTGQTWTPEQENIFTSNLANASFSSNASEIQLIVPRVPYMTARIFRSKFTYTFTVSPGWKFLRLHFYPTRYGSDLDAVKSIFSVTVNGFTLLKNFNAASTANASGLPFSYLIKEYIVPVLGEHNKTLNLTLTPSPNSLAFLNGVEIISMPDRLYTKGGFDNNITDVGTSNDFKIDDKTVLETVYRLNIGGKMIHENETEMFRQWLQDESFIQRTDSVDRAVKVETVRTINYTEKTPAYVAHEDVYLTFPMMYNLKYPEQNPEFFMTWLLPVDAGFNYLVRLHFCETLTIATEPDKRLFSINIGNKVAKKKTDVIDLSGGSLIPMYLDFHTFLASHASKSGERHILRLDLLPYKNESSRGYSFNLNGIEILKLNDTNGNLSVSDYKTGKSSHAMVMIILIAVGTTVGLATFIVVLVLLMRQMNRKKNSVVVFKIPLKKYTYKELRIITKSFSHMVGKGGFGIVYEGNLCNGVKVAVKVLKDLKGSGEDFINEVLSMSQTSHVNIVSLLGFCYEGSKRAIVYEFLENGSLDQFISRETSLTRDVATLYGIALGIARGLEYLHYGCKTRIVHFDIKPQNILLDEKLCPKVSDFGLAKLCEKRESIVSLVDRRGTIGYIAPEVFSRTYGGVSYKSDVYSYGMLILEMMGARNKETTASSVSTTYFPDWIYKDLENGEQTWIFGDEITEEEKDIATKMILVSLWCIQLSPLDRPPINRVIEMLEGSLDALVVPLNPSMHTVIEYNAESSLLSDGGDTSKNR